MTVVVGMTVAVGMTVVVRKMAVVVRQDREMEIPAYGAVAPQAHGTGPACAG
jgi:hypothetical protein